MNGRAYELAVYGKGGIGKSTICANLSAALALRGRRVLQIGCDPKHDSTRLLMGGREIITVLDQLRTADNGSADVEAVLGRGWMNIGCIEAGGPKPGVGCAGRGIISAFEFLEKEKVKERYDIVTYDVLGDVVCGGFAVPIRREYSDAVFLVTSGEFMALYAANNILRGIKNFDGDSRKRVAGIIFNRRSLAGEDERVERFARAVGLPICAVVPRSDLFAKAEAVKCTVMAMGVSGPERSVFLHLAEQIEAGLTLYNAMPLTDGELEDCVLGSSVRAVPGTGFTSGDDSSEAAEMSDVSDASAESGSHKHSTAPQNRPPLFGCAFNGASTAAINLKDAIVIAHSPRSCAFYTWQNISSSGRRNLFNRGILMPSAISPNFAVSGIDGHDAVFGGIDRLKQSVKDALDKKPAAVIVISSCVSGIIGDDVLTVEDMSTPQTPVIVIPADGVMTGDYMSGIKSFQRKAAERLISTNVEIKPGTVNIVGEYGLGYYTEENFDTIKTLLNDMGISIGCRFLGNATVGQVNDFMAAPLNILAFDSPDNLELKNWLQERYGCRFFDSCLPVGFKATEGFLTRLGELFGCSDAVSSVTEREREVFMNKAVSLRPKLAGKRVLISTINTNMDWLLDTAREVGVECVWIGVLNYLRQELRVTDEPSRKALVHEITDHQTIAGAVEMLKPDIVLSNYTGGLPPGDYIADNMPMTQKVGFHSGIDVMERWVKLLDDRREGEWNNDRMFYEKYYT